MEIRIHDCDVQNCSARANGADDANDSRNVNGFECGNESDGRTDKRHDDRAASTILVECSKACLGAVSVVWRSMGLSAIRQAVSVFSRNSVSFEKTS